MSAIIMNKKLIIMSVYTHILINLSILSREYWLASYIWWPRNISLCTVSASIYHNCFTHRYEFDLFYTIGIFANHIVYLQLLHALSSVPDIMDDGLRFLKLRTTLAFRYHRHTDHYVDLRD